RDKALSPATRGSSISVTFLLLYPKRLVSLEALERMRQVFEEGVTLDDLLEGLDEVRQKIYDERYVN
ncbi:MAG: hypothetical protein ACE5NP_05150, partial [Anaerolineae bacterium]